MIPHIIIQGSGQVFACDGMNERGVQRLNQQPQDSTQASVAALRVDVSSELPSRGPAWQLLQAQVARHARLAARETGRLGER